MKLIVAALLFFSFYAQAVSVPTSVTCWNQIIAPSRQTPPSEWYVGIASDANRDLRLLLVHKGQLVVNDSVRMLPDHRTGTMSYYTVGPKNHGGALVMKSRSTASLKINLGLPFEIPDMNCQSPGTLNFSQNH